jgi:AcrR family transcriptional regulator
LESDNIIVDSNIGVNTNLVFSNKDLYDGSMAEQPGRRERKRQETRQAIAEAAMRLFNERGFDHVTIAEVAEAADVSVNTVFNHFKTKEELFFGPLETMELQLARLLVGRGSGEPVVAFLRRRLVEVIDKLRELPRHQAGPAGFAMMRHVFEQSPALQVHAAHLARSRGKRLEDDLSESLARDSGAELNDVIPHLVASQILTIFATLLAEAERRRRAGMTPDEIHAPLRAAVETALEMLEHGIGDYGAQERRSVGPKPAMPGVPSPVPGRGCREERPKPPRRKKDARHDA